MAQCPYCGAELEIVHTIFYKCPNGDYLHAIDTHNPDAGKRINKPWYPDDNMYKEKPPVGCRACGGPYPMCKDGCNIFED